MAGQETGNVNELLQIRRDKLTELQQAGKNPFVITKYGVTHHSAEIKDNYDKLEGQEVCIAGRMMSKRIMGKASFCHIQDLLDSPWICGCLDLGHANMTYHDVPGFIRGSKDHFRYVHIHDNDGRDDLHMYPYTGILDWDRFTAGLKAIDYRGDLNFETFNGLDKYDPELAPEVLRLAAATAALFRRRVLGD